MIESDCASEISDFRNLGHRSKSFSYPGFKVGFPYSGQTKRDETHSGKNIVELSKKFTCEKNNVPLHEKQIPIKEILNTSFHPEDSVLFIFAIITYCEDIKYGMLKGLEELKTDIIDKELCDAIDQLQLEKSWKVYAVGENLQDGYFGVVFYNTNQNQLIISHRGTKIDRFRSDAQDKEVEELYEVGYMSQIKSACTFCAHVLQDFKGKNLSISITGHSFGGLLAQITTFTSEYLEYKVNQSVKKEREPGRLIHTVAFDSPGFYEVLYPLVKSYFNKNDFECLASDLDITVYLINPNPVNSFISHKCVNNLFQIKSRKNGVEYGEKIIVYRRKVFLRFLLKLNDADILSISHWPRIPDVNSLQAGGFELLQSFALVTKFLLSIKLYEEYYSAEKILCSGDEKENENKNLYSKIKTEVPNRKSKNLCEFSKNEIDFLKNWGRFQDKSLIPPKMNSILKQDELESFDKFLPKFQVSDKKIICKSEEEMKKLFNRVKHLLAYVPEARDILKNDAGNFEAMLDLYSLFSKNYLTKLPQWEIDFDDTINLKRFLKSDGGIYCLVSEQDIKNEVFRIRNIIEKLDMKSFNPCYLGLKELGELEIFLNVEQIFENPNNRIDSLLIIDCNEGAPHNASVKTLVEKLVKIDKTKKKLIFVLKDNSELFTNLKKTCRKVWQRNNVNGYSWHDLSDNTRKKLLEKNILTVKNEKISLENFLGVSYNNHVLEDDKKFFSPEIILHILENSSNLVELCTKKMISYDDLKVNIFPIHEKIKMSQFVEFLQKSRKVFEKPVLFMITCTNPAFSINVLNLNKEEESSIKDFVHIAKDDRSNQFYELCRKNLDKRIFWIHVSLENVTNVRLLEIFDSDFYIERYFYKEQKTADESVMLNSKGLNSTYSSVISKEVEFSKITDKAVVIVEEQGMGKTSTLLKLATQMDRSWVLWIDLSEINFNFTDITIDTDNIVDFLLKFNKTSRNLLVEALLKFCLCHPSNIPVVIFFDSFEAVPSETLKPVIKILKFLKNETNAQIWIATTFLFKNMLEEELEISAKPMKSINVDERKKYLKSIRLAHLNFNIDEEYNTDKDNISSEEIFMEMQEISMLQKTFPSLFQSVLKKEWSEIIKNYWLMDFKAYGFDNERNIFMAKMIENELRFRIRNCLMYLNAGEVLDNYDTWMTSLILAWASNKNIDFHQEGLEKIELESLLDIYSVDDTKREIANKLISVLLNVYKELKKKEEEYCLGEKEKQRVRTMRQISHGRMDTRILLQGLLKPTSDTSVNIRFYSDL